jgi:dGTPase
VNHFYSEFDTANLTPARGSSEKEHRSPFQIDRDRILHSAAFRRLQGKTQVFYSFLVGDYDFYRTRLTHSLEVAQVGRSICVWLQKNCRELEDTTGVDPDLVEAACLAHDLGHPPFGHTGERALHRLMQPYGGFEGNGQTLRLLTETLFNDGLRGMNPTRGLVDAILKYKTLRRETPEAKNHYVYDEQESHLRFVNGGRTFPAELTAGKTRNAFRSLECQIMDWADDTAYSINDLSDAILLKYITVPDLEAWAGKQTLDRVEQEQIDFLIDTIRQGKVEGRLARGIGENIRACSLRARQNFLSGATQRYSLELVIDEAVQRKTKLNKRIAFELIFDTHRLHQLDFKAEGVINRMFEVLEERYVQRSGRPSWHLLPESVEQALERIDDVNYRARLVCDWLANLTDRSAWERHQRLFDTSAGAMGKFL